MENEGGGQASNGGGGSVTIMTENQKKVPIPWDLVNEILLRLPVKSLVRFKLACKLWNSLISDPKFAKSHFDLAASPTERLMFMSPFAPEIFSIDFNESFSNDSACASLKLDFLPQESFYVEILGSCRGFLLVNCDSKLYVWNPSTGGHNSIDWSPISPSHTQFMFYMFLRGFGYDPVKDDYLVVFGCYEPVHMLLNDYDSRIDFFSLRANAWEQIQGMRLPYINCSDYKDNQIGRLFNGAIHWLVSRHRTAITVILAFDLTERSAFEMPLPEEFQFNNFKLSVLRVLRESLNLCAVRMDQSAEIWVMEEYGVQASWTRTLVVTVNNIPNDGYFFPICSTKNGDIVGTDLGTGLVKWNEEGQLQEHRCYLNGPFGSVASMYTQSLLSIPCGNEQAS